MFGIDAVIALELLPDSAEELLPLANLRRLASRVPAFVIKPADQHRELRPELRHLLHREPVAQRMQDGSQGQVGLLLLLPAQYLHQLVEPCVGLLYRRVKHVETRLDTIIFSFYRAAAATEYDEPQCRDDEMSHSARAESL